MIYGAFRSIIISILLRCRRFIQYFRAAGNISLPRHTWFLAAALALSVATPAPGDDRRGSAVTFVHATDPHFFVPAAQKPETKTTGDKQESLNKKALTDMLQRLQGLSGPDGSPAFLVLTGDLGVDPCDIPKASQMQPAPTGQTPAIQAIQTKAQPNESPTSKPCVPDDSKRKDQIQRVAQALGSSPLKEIYLVAGNNDVANEDPDGVSLGYFNQFIDDAQKKLDEDKTGVHLYNLTACYAASAGASSCYADIPRTTYRLIGFPSYSFKNSGGKSTNNDTQAKAFATFLSLLNQARQAGKQVLILSHVPEIDDPFAIAQDRYAAKSPDPANDKDPKNPRSAWSAWNVTTKLLNDWKDVLASDSVVAVLAGHLHDSHKEIYRPPYAWSSDGDYRLGFRKLFLAPPLGLKNQDSSPIQARGFSLVTLTPNHIEALLFWYNQETGEFKPDPPAQEANNSGWKLPRFVSRIWQLDSGNSPLRLAVLLIALLTAYLTVVAIWNIPAVDNPLAPKTGGDKKTSDQKTATDSPFANDFGKTVIAGLSGLAVTEVAKSLGGDQSTETRWLYIIWFVFFFFVLLFGLSLFRALVEGLRALVAIPRYSLARTGQPRKRTSTGKAGSDPLDEQDSVSWSQFYRWASYWWMRFVHWFFSLRVPLLTGLDTFINLIQGKNQTMTRVFSDTIIDQQRNSIRVAHAIRKDLTRLIERRIFELRQEDNEKNNHKKTAVEDEQASVLAPVRVGISVLAADQSTVFYISQSPGSAKKPFPKRSVAWMSVFTGQIRWVKSSYLEDSDTYKRIVLLDNSSGVIADDVKTILLSSYYQDRNADYQAFVMFPFPWPQRAFGSDYVKGAIHISFSREKDFSRIWDPSKATQTDASKDPTDSSKATQADASKHPADASKATPANANEDPDFLDQIQIDKDKYLIYRTPPRMLDEWCDAEVRAALINSLAVLDELLRKFNETIYKSYIEPGESD